MKIIIDTKTNTIKAGNKSFDELDEVKRNATESFVRDFLYKHTQLTDYEEDCMWMSYRYCIGRHTIASNMHAGSIWKNCRNRISNDRQLFTAFDINREIEQRLSLMTPHFYFPATSFNDIYTSAVDIVCKFIEDYNIKSKDDFLKYRNIYIKLSDNDCGYTIETETWEEYLRIRVHEIMKLFISNIKINDAWSYFEEWRSGDKTKIRKSLRDTFEKLYNELPKSETYYMTDFEDLFVWNDLVHCFDYKHHHKSLLIDGTECEWFWTWINNTEKQANGNFYKVFGYKRVRVPLNNWNGNVTTYIPDESIKEDIY